MGDRQSPGESPIQRALSDWLRTPFKSAPDVSPSELLVTLLQGGQRSRDEYDTILDLLVEALPQLRSGLTPESADFTARLLFDYLHPDATAVVSRHRILAFVGMGADHHRVGSRSMTALTRRALRTGEVVRTQDRAIIGCRRTDCPLHAAIVAPLVVSGEVVGALKLYHRHSHPIADRDERIARGLARVFGVYLELADLDARAALVTRAELDALRAQISPHFLFNTLTTIAALTRVDAERAHDMIVDFAEFFRESLSQRGESVTLREELQYVERYLRFEQARLGERLAVEYAVDPAALDIRVPVLAVQPLVENAVVHGIAPKGGRGRLTISARRSRGGFEIVVADDGVGVRDHAGREKDDGRLGVGVALNNIHHRLRGLFGPASGLRVESDEHAGTTVSFWISGEAERA